MNSLHLARAAVNDLPVFETLVRLYPYKGFQRQAEGIDPHSLHRYLAETMRLELADGATGAWLVRQDQEPLAGATLSPNPWHGRFYNLRMARTHTFLSYLQPARTTPLLCEALLREAARHAYEQLSVRIDGGEFENLRLLEAQGFSLVEISTKLSAPIHRASAPLPQGLIVRPVEPRDRTRIVEISGASTRSNHLFNDPQLDREATQNLFRAWVERCLDGLASYMFVAEDERQGILGFVTYLTNPLFNAALNLRLVVLDYIVLAPDSQGCGIGPLLLEHSLAALGGTYDQVELRTSQHNYAALALYNRYGFRTLSTDFILHWFSD